MPKKSMSGMKKPARKGLTKGRRPRGAAAGPARPRRVATGSGAGSRVVTQTALPSVTGLTMTRSTFGYGGRAQAVADYDVDSSLRVVGRDLFYAPITSGSSDPAAGFGGAATYYAAITPKEISDRLANIEKIYQWYAIRALRIFYAPASGSTSVAQIALGYLSNYQVSTDSGLSAPTQTQVLEMSPAALFPAWQPAQMDVLHRGTKLFSCEYVSTVPSIEQFQGVLACTIMNPNSETTYGQLWFEFVVDFYQPCPILASISREDRLMRGVFVALKSTGQLLRVPGGLRHVCGLMVPEEIKIPPRPCVPDSRPPFTPGGLPPTDPDTHPPFYPGFRGGRWVVDPIDESVVVSASSTPTTAPGPVKVPSTKK